MTKQQQTEPQEERRPNIHQRLLAVIRDSGALAKEGKRYAGGYHQIDDVVEHLRPLLIKHGVTIAPNVLDHKMDQHQDNQGRAVHAAEVLLLVSFYNADNPEDVFTSSSAASGFSYEDKSLAVAYSYALKNVLLAVFQLRGQPDAESGNVTTASKREKVKQQRNAELDKKDPMTDAQAAELEAYRDDPRVNGLVATIAGKEEHIKPYLHQVLIERERWNATGAKKLIDFLMRELGSPRVEDKSPPEAGWPPQQADEM